MEGVVRISTAIALVVVAVGTIVIASELRYQSCIDRAVAEYPPGIGDVRDLGAFEGWGGDEVSTVGGAADKNGKSRRSAIANCSRLPW